MHAESFEGVSVGSLYLLAVGSSDTAALFLLYHECLLPRYLHLKLEALRLNLEWGALFTSAKIWERSAVGTGENKLAVSFARILVNQRPELKY